MSSNGSSVPIPLGVAPGSARVAVRTAILERALRKRAAGVPTYSVPEAASLLSISPEHLYRLVKADEFPAVEMRGRYLVPAAALDDLLGTATESGSRIDVAGFTQSWAAGFAGGDAA